MGYWENAQQLGSEERDMPILEQNLQEIDWGRCREESLMM